MNPAAIQIIRELSREMKPIPTSCDPVLPSFPGIRAVIFDVYGTLFISSCGDQVVFVDGSKCSALRYSA